MKLLKPLPKKTFSGLLTALYRASRKPGSLSRSIHQPSFAGLGLLILIAFTGRAEAQITVPDFGFESPVIGSSASYFQYEPASSSWTFTGGQSTGFTPGSGIAADGSFFTSFNSAAPQGFQVAFIQDTGSFSQSLSGFTIGDTYDLTFLAAQRAEADPIPSEALTTAGTDWNVAGQTWNVTVDGNAIQSFAPGESATAYRTYSADFVATAATETVGFAGTDLGGGDNTIFIDDIQIADVPEPSTWAMLSGGLFLLAMGGTLANRRSN